MKKSYILAFDQGTTSSRSLLFDSEFNIVGLRQKEIQQFYPDDGWVEQNPEEIFNTQVETAINVLRDHNIKANQIAGIGITNQRESFIVWDKRTGRAVYNCIVWQDKRTTDICESIEQKEVSNMIKRKTGLRIDPYFSSTKLMWLLKNHPEIKKEAKRGNYLFGTIDTWLIWKLSKGKYHITDVSNASRTQLFNIRTLEWDEELLDFFGVPKQMMPKITDSAGELAQTDKNFFDNYSIPLCGIAGDQQAALFGQNCLEQGMAKNTFGTGSFMLMNVGGKCPSIQNDGLLRTLAWRINGNPTYALEGSVFFAGATIKWLKDKLNLITKSEESEKLAASVESNGGIYFVPAFTGLGTPYWDAEARGTITGLTLSAEKAHIVRAALESLAYQSRDVLEIMNQASETESVSLKVDGGASKNKFLLQFLADINNLKVIKPANIETTALGAAFLAGIGSKITDTSKIRNHKSKTEEYKPNMSQSIRMKLYKNWKRAVERSLEWYKD